MREDYPIWVEKFYLVDVDKDLILKGPYDSEDIAENKNKGIDLLDSSNPYAIGVGNLLRISEYLSGDYDQEKKIVVPIDDINCPDCDKPWEDHDDGECPSNLNPEPLE